MTRYKEAFFLRKRTKNGSRFELARLSVKVVGPATMCLYCLRIVYIQEYQPQETQPGISWDTTPKTRDLFRPG